ncbi:MAG: hypothetical protein LZT29_01783 [Pantoea stewartii]|uniref:hypothetical protein n=1 Tax=Pantoea stewartii TaxID=66269 RepID=UPI0024BDA984|nr:hypothetical protein [Pantoea stewartii]WHS98827.1 MAG: hypothetical protein LZT29_01783 [Pantoea stewartii]
MPDYPQHGERWQHSQGWTVTVLRLSAAPFSVACANPEFSHEVLYRYDSDGQVTSAPLAWFLESYTLKAASPRSDMSADGGHDGFSSLDLHPSVTFSRWREPVMHQPTEPDDGHYSNYL